MDKQTFLAMLRDELVKMNVRPTLKQKPRALIISSQNRRLIDSMAILSTLCPASVILIFGERMMITIWSLSPVKNKTGLTTISTIFIPEIMDSRMENWLS